MTQIPNPNGDKYIILYDAAGGQSYQIPASVVAGLPVVDLSVNGLQLTTVGVSDSVDKRFVTDAELSNLVALAPIAAYAPAGAEVLLNLATLVDLNTATPPTIYTVPTGKSAIVTRFLVYLASTSLTTVSFSIGFNSANYNDVLADATHTELTGATLYTMLAAKAGAKIGTSAQALKLKNNTLQGGAATVSIAVFGITY